MYKKLIDQYELCNFFSTNSQCNINKKIPFWKKAMFLRTAIKRILSCKIVFHQFDIEWVSGAFRSKKEIYCLSLMFSRELLVLVFEKKDCWKDLNVLLFLQRQTFYVSSTECFFSMKEIYYPTRITNNAIFLDVI